MLTPMVYICNEAEHIKLFVSNKISFCCKPGIQGQENGQQIIGVLPFLPLAKTQPLCFWQKCKKVGVFLSISIFVNIVYNWQYFFLHWQNYTYYTVIITVNCHFHTYEIQYDCQIHSFLSKIHLVYVFASCKNAMYRNNYPLKNYVQFSLWQLVNIGGTEELCSY